MGSISMPQGRGNRQHNLRNYGEGKLPSNVDASRTEQNIVWKDETTAHAYHRIFDDAVSEYNAKQKRKDRQIKDYRTHILNSKNGEKEFYEDVLQWGKQEDFIEHPEWRDIAKAKANEWLEKINIRLGLIPKKDIEDKRRELVGYYKACEPYLTNDMRMAINNEDVKGFGALVSRLTASNPDGTVTRRDPGWEELFDFEIKFEEYLEMKKKNVKTADILKELNKPELHNRMKR